MEPRTIVGGLRAPEGPVALGNGEIAVTEIQGQCITRCSKGSSSTIAATKGGPNGATLGSDGVIYVANNGGLFGGSKGFWQSDDFGNGRIQRVTLDGEVSDVVTDFPGVESPNRPNDICFGPDGLLYFTDPANWEDFANLKPGRLWKTDGKGSAVLLAEVPWFPNGLAFGADSTLYVAQSVTQKILAFDWKDGELSGQRDFCQLPKGVPDGFCLATNGDFYVCGAIGNAVCVFDSEGKTKEVIEFPEGTDPLNCCLDEGVLYVTCAGPGELVAFDVGAEPLPLHPFRD